jgi:hypothetical protein
LINYADVDETPLPGLSYYRLKQVDDDGTESYSDMVPVMFAGGGPMVFPNPTDGAMLWLSIDAPDEERLSIDLLDGLGRVVRTEVVTLHAGRQVVDLLAGRSLSPGAYTARLLRGDVPSMLPVVVQ